MPHRPKLNAELLRSTAPRPSAVSFPPAQVLDLPERVVQFGTGGFLRGFVEHFIDAANHAGTFDGRIVAIGSTGSGRDDVVNAQDGLFTLVVEGMENARATREFRLVTSLSRAIDAVTNWDAVLELAANPDLELVFSNTTEVGIETDPDNSPGSPPRSFPGKLAVFLAARAAAFDYSADAGLTIIPCELIEKNGDRLKEIVRDLAERWSFDPRFLPWLESSVIFCNTLVDRIVPGEPSLERRKELEDLLGYHDDLLTICEPYRLFAIEGDGSNPALRFASADRGVIITDDIEPYRLNKVRLLNGAHSLLAPLALQCGATTVYEAVSDEAIGAYLRRTMYDELVASLDVQGAGGFARQVVERFSNPYLAHSLFDITLQGTTKMRVRVVPSIVEFFEREHRAPELIAFGFAAYILFLRGDLQELRRSKGLAVPVDDQAVAVRDAWDSVENAAEVAHNVCGNFLLWGIDLNDIPGFTDAVARDITDMTRDGIHAALEHLLYRSAPAREKTTV
jgi:tagaturonate reductase